MIGLRRRGRGLASRAADQHGPSIRGEFSRDRHSPRARSQNLNGEAGQSLGLEANGFVLALLSSTAQARFQLMCEGRHRLGRALGTFSAMGLRTTWSRIDLRRALADLR